MENNSNNNCNSSGNGNGNYMTVIKDSEKVIRKR